MHILISPIACITHIHYQYQPLHRAKVILWFIHLIESELHSPILLDWCPVLTQINAHQPIGSKHFGIGAALCSVSV